MEARRADGEELARWACEHAPGLIARAEAEAVAALRDALIEASLGTRRLDPAVGEGRPLEREPESGRSAMSPGGAAPGAPDDQGELLWVYCVMRASDIEPSGLHGVHASGAVEREEAAELAALVSQVPRGEFGPEPLRRNLNDLGWLERVARDHEAVLEAALQTSTIVPLRMCTLYESAQSVRQMLQREHDALFGAIRALDGRLEWAVKVLVAKERLFQAARARHEEGGAALEEELDRHGEGGAYMVRRRHERRTRELASELAAEVAERVHARLADWAIDAVTRPAQNRELSGHEGEMLLNGAYLVERDRTAELRRLVDELETQHRDLGARVELSGPWPPYNFVPDGDLHQPV